MLRVSLWAIICELWFEVFVDAHRKNCWHGWDNKQASLDFFGLVEVSLEATHESLGSRFSSAFHHSIQASFSASQTMVGAARQHLKCSFENRLANSIDCCSTSARSLSLPACEYRLRSCWSRSQPFIGIHRPPASEPWRNRSVPVVLATPQQERWITFDWMLPGASYVS